MPFPRLLIITSCTGEKKFKPVTALTLKDFRDKENLELKEQALREFRCPAAELYTGQQHSYVIQGLQVLRECLGKESVHLKIVSAGYGLLDETDQVVPYEVTFNDLKAQELDIWATELNISLDLEVAIQDYDLVFFLLGEKYLRAISLPIQSRPNQTFIFFASKQSDRHIKKLTAKSHVIHLSNLDAKKYHCGLIGLKGLLLLLLADHFAGDSVNDLKTIYEKPQYIESIFEKVNQNQQLSLPFLKNIPIVHQSKKVVSQQSKNKIDIPDTPPAPNQGFGLQYFIPEWDDLVDPNYDFLTDSYDKKRDFYLEQVYAHEIYDTPNYDGVLVSRVVIEDKKSKEALIEKIGIDKFLRFPKPNIMGDCGAFGYIAEEVPPYSTDNVLNFYDQLHFNYGVSVDHLIVGDFAQPGIREKRYELTIKNAEEFLKKHRERGYSFTPIGAVQGWSPETYAEAAKELISMGYEYIGLGGLVRSQNKVIYEILKAVRPHLTEKVRMHLFGIARTDAIEAFHHLGVTSIDSASPLRRAWLGADANYHTLSGKKYAAIRVPPINSTGLRTKKIIQAGIATEDHLKKLETQSLKALRDFDDNRLDLEQTLEAILEYDELLEVPKVGETETQFQSRQQKRRDKHEMKYCELLQDLPWKKCNCKICNELGIDVVIFRNNNRNRRRGFHNTYVFYQQLNNLFGNHS
jgi:hypothetical protein